MALIAEKWRTLAGSLVANTAEHAAALKAQGREIFDLTSGEPDFDNTGYVEEWDDWSDVNNAELIRIIQRLVAKC